MSFVDAIKKSVLSGFNTDITTAQIVMSLLMALVAGLFILMIYRLTMRGIAFNRSYEITLLLVTTISGMIVLTITSNLALSLGMVGALSIVRFRTALKETSDTAFMFWAVAAGITAGAGFYLITLIGCLFIGLVVVLAVRLTKNVARPYLLVVRSVSGDTNAAIEKLLEQHHINRRLSSVVQNERYTEIIYEVSVSAAQQRLVSAVRAMQGVTAVSLVDCRN
ncbi:MAG: DUF4956 domain-containing protein [Clostridiales bacterium]|nr:DUF4956 domain-containing protein [Candidatus Coliplasma caballi]